jgi:dTDP-4-amino-4,6-dideoxygalactose transaminase
MKNIPLVDLKASFSSIKKDVMQAIEEVFKGMSLYLGPNLSALEEEFASYCGTRYAIGVGSGTEAIHLALRACGIGEDDEVITVPNTFFATVEAIIHAGARPVFVDIDPVTYTMDVSVLEKRIGRKTKAVIPVHMYGQSADMKRIMELSEKHDFKVIEDACQAHGALYKGKRCGSIGDAGCFSFYFTKNLGAYGEGGIVVTDNPQIAEMVRLYRNHGHTSKYEHSVIGYNSRLDEVQSAILRIKLRHLDSCNDRRRIIADKYNKALASTPLNLPVEVEGRRHVYHLYVVRCKNRDHLQKHLSDKGISTGIHYKNPVHLQSATRFLGYMEGDFPAAEAACREILSLPMYPELKEDDIQYIVESIKDFFKSK